MMKPAHFAIAMVLVICLGVLGANLYAMASAPDRVSIACARVTP